MLLLGFLYRTLLFYTLSNGYLFWSLYRVSGRRRWVFLTLPWFLLMGFFPVVFMMLPPGKAQLVLGRLGTVWLAPAFFGLMVFLTLDGIRLALWALGKLRPGKPLPRPRRSRVRVAVILFCACLFAYGLHEARSLKVTSLELATAKLPPNMERLRLVFASDLHIGPQTGLAMLRNTVGTILAQRPDVILLGGDILDDALQGTTADSAELARLRAPLGVYAVLGNHDAFGDHARAVAFLQGAGITVLSPGRVSAGPLTILGVDDPRVMRQKGLESELPALLRGLDKERFTVLLDHRPVMRPEALGTVDLQLSGHSHGGQIIFLKPLMLAAFGTREGLNSYAAEGGTSLLFVTTGTGFSKLPVRILMPPEIVVIDLVPLSAPSARSVPDASGGRGMAPRTP